MFHRISDKKLYGILILINLPLVLSAASRASESTIFNWVYQNFIVILGATIIVAAMVTLMNFINSMFKYENRQILKAKGILPEPVDTTPKPSFIERMYDKAWSLVPVEKEADIMLDHDYDGIQELDNRLPPWWVYTFYITIVWAGAYIYVSHFSDIGLSQHEEYVQEMKVAENKKIDFMMKQANAINETNATLLVDAESLEAGKSVFIASCAACHGQLGEGGVGPNLTDTYWIHGGDVKDIFKTIKHGVPEKGMIAWKAQLPPSAIHQLSSYIVSLEGTNPPNQKEPQGEIYKRELSDNLTKEIEE